MLIFSYTITNLEHILKRFILVTKLIEVLAILCLKVTSGFQIDSAGIFSFVANPESEQ